MSRIKKIIGLTLGLAVIILATGLTAYRLELLIGFPKGVDAYAYLTRVGWILTRFPQIHWNPSWNSGNFFWLWSYPPTSFMATTGVKIILGITPEQAWNLVNFACFLVFAVGFYLTLASWADYWLAIPIALLAVTTPALYSWWGHGGNYARIWGMGFYGLTMAAFVSYLKRPRKLIYGLLIISLALSLTAHMLFTALTLASLAGYLLFAIEGIRKKVIISLKTIGVGILLSSFWYVPMAATTTSERFLEPSLGQPVPWSDLFSLNPKLPYFSLPLYFTLVLGVVLLMAIGAFFLKNRSGRLIWGAVPAFTLGLLGSLAYAFGRNFSWFPKNLSASGFAPFAAFPFIIIFGAFTTASVLGVFFSRYKGSIGVILLALVASAIIVFLSSRIEFTELHIYDMARKGEWQSLAIPPVEKLNHEPIYRFGTDSAFVSDWFNYFYPNQPQTRDYIYQAIPYKSWQYFQEYSLWTQDNRYPEAEWLLDWYGVKYLTAGFASPATKFEKFLSRPDLFEEKYASNRDDYYLFEYRNPRPILTTSEAPVVLVVGEIEDYEILVRALAMVGWGTDKIIPVYGGNKIDRFDGDLDSFKAIFFYRCQVAHSASENLLINQYLERGGRILIESSPTQSILVWPDWAPVEQGQLVAIEGDWELEINDQFSITGKDFSPPVFKDDFWKVAQGKPFPEANVLAKANGLPVVVERKAGEGVAIWSSLNLPYHAESYRNEKEAKFLTELLGFTNRKMDLGAAEILKNEPEKRIWRIGERAVGLVWKESWFPRWYVTWQDSQGNKGRLFPLMAGPALSYIFLPQEAVYPLLIKANYHFLFWDYFGWGVTLVTLGIFVIYLCGGRLWQTITARIPKSFLNIEDWWNEE